MEFSIRAATEADAEAMVALLNPIIKAGIYTAMATPLSVEGQQAFLRSFPEQGVFLVAVCHATGKVIGMQDVMPITPDSPVFAHVGAIGTFVSLTAHRAGIGRSLTAATCQAARQKGYRKLMATIRADNPQAVAFYRSQGFRVIGVAEMHAFLGGVYLDEVLAEKHLE
jgi:L-amino acid N-acyltransferase YncA